MGELRLRPLRAADAPAWLAYLADPRVIEHTSFPAVDLSCVETMLARELEGYAAATSRRWALADSGDRLIGTCGFSNWSLPHAQAELVYDLSPAFWGRGVMRAAVHQVLSWAFDAARFIRVHAFVMTSNAPSIRLLESLSFVREGTLAQYRIARGVARDFHVYALVQAAAGNTIGAPPNSTLPLVRQASTGDSVELFVDETKAPLSLLSRIAAYKEVIRQQGLESGQGALSFVLSSKLTGGILKAQ